jgi:hypothetical protein
MPRLKAVEGTKCQASVPSVPIVEKRHREEEVDCLPRLMGVKTYDRLIDNMSANFSPDLSMPCLRYARQKLRRVDQAPPILVDHEEHS